MNLIITLDSAGEDSGPFELYSDVDGYISAFESNVTKASLLSGHSTSSAPDTATTIRVKSTGVCVNYLDISVEPTTTTTTTTVALTPITITEFPVNDIRTFVQLGGATYVGSQSVVSRFTLIALNSSTGYVDVAVTGGELTAVNDFVEHTSTLNSPSSTWDYSMDFLNAEVGDTATIRFEVMSVGVDGLPVPSFIDLTFTGVTTTTTTTTAAPPAYINYMGESTITATSASQACSLKTTVRGYQKTYVRGGDPSINVGDTFPNESVAGWVALSYQGTGPFYAVELDSNGTVITLGGVCP